MPRQRTARPVVLLVDDNDAVRGLLQLVLEDHYEVIAVASGEAGLQEVAQRRVDLVLLDLLMPAMDGWEVFERLCRLNGRRPKVIFVTGIDSSAAAVSALKLGAEDWVVKPFDQSALLMQLRSLLPPKRAIIIQGGGLGARATIAVMASMNCRLAVSHHRAQHPAESGPECLVIDATGTGTEAGLTAVLRGPPISLVALSSATAAALHYVSGHYPDISVAHLARHAGRSTNYVRERFKIELGLAPRDYIARVRVEVIKQRLREARCPSLDRLAEEVGLCDAPHLSRTFTRYAEEPPSSYRGNIQGDR